MSLPMFPCSGVGLFLRASVPPVVGDLGQPSVVVSCTATEYGERLIHVEVAELARTPLACSMATRSRTSRCTSPSGLLLNLIIRVVGTVVSRLLRAPACADATERAGLTADAPSAGVARRAESQLAGG